MLTTEGLIFGLLTVVCASTYGLVARATLKDAENPLAFSILFTLSSAVLSLGLFLIEPLDFSTSSLKYTLLLLLSACLYGIYDATQFSARKYLEASSLSIVLQIAPVIAFVLSVFILKEGVTAAKLFAVSLIMFGNIIAIYRSHHITRLGLLFGVAMATVSGFTYVIDKVAFPHTPFALYSIAVYIIPAIVVYIIFKIRGGKSVEVTKVWREFTWRIPLISLCGVATYYFLYRTFAITDASVAVPLVASSTVLTVIGGILILGERGNIPRKLIGAALVFTGVLLLRL